MNGNHSTKMKVVIVCLSLVLSALAQSNWTWRNPLPQGNTLNGMASNGNLFLAVGNLGTVISSPDDIQWTLANSRNVSSLYSVKWTGNQFVIVGAGGTILTSPDGSTWTSRNSGVTVNLQSLGWADSQLVAVGANGVILASRDGINWEQRNSVIHTNLSSVARGDTQWVAVGDSGTILSSSDGSNWTRRVSNTALALSSVTWADSLWVAVGASGTLATSSDGIAWDTTLLTPFGSLLTSFYSVAANPGSLDSGSARFVIVGMEVVRGEGSSPYPSLPLVYTSTDGHHWNIRGSNLGDIPQSVYWENNQYRALAGYKFLTSADGINWSSSISGFSSPFSSVIWTPKSQTGLAQDQLVAVGLSGTIQTSQDGIHWTISRTPASTDLYSVTWMSPSGSSDSGKYVAVGYLNGGTPDPVAISTITTSPDGMNWTPDTQSNLSIFPTSVTWTGKQLVVVGKRLGYDTVLTSPDAIHWTHRSTGIASDLISVNWAGPANESGTGQLIALGTEGQILSSPDGITWTTRNSGVTTDLSSVIWMPPAALGGNGQIVVVGNAGVILTSPDGITWTSRTSGTNNDLTSVTMADQKAIALGNSGTALTSSDGIHWTAENTGSAVNFSSGAWTGNSFVAVSLNSEILTSTLIPVSILARTKSQKVNVSSQGYPILLNYQSRWYHVDGRIDGGAGNLLKLLSAP